MVKDAEFVPNAGNPNLTILMATSAGTARS
jgi:hypothetical protein